MNFGPKIREIRISKGYSQKAIYQDIISKSYAIEFEKGKHSIATTLLIEILDRLSMDIDEFLFIDKGYLLNDYSAYIYKLSKYSNTHDLKSLYELLKKYADKTRVIDQLRFAEIRCRIQAIENFNRTGRFDDSATIEEDRETIQNYLVEIETWTLREIQFFGNTIEFLDFEQHFPLFRNLSKSFPLYVEYDKGREIFCAMLVNVITQAIRHGYFDYAEVLIYQLQLLSSDSKEFFHRLLTKYFDNILSIKRNSRDGQAIENCKIILDLLIELGHSSIVGELKALSTDVVVSK
ncbi:Rgg/GadR/MutR family transcriptional regulator [Enterococcus durans]|uniref:helix-turn-helix domain-containing protein n=1 Tax=Enterococcus durans TaxID=53345 RepID=UPI0028906DC5|nr:helix-turn-helix domain-containing protein [Enterococcus durans]MDT2837673.1 Rgg/GadR/MutR family transcriptional regulator [Enterococcus durans]